MSWLMEGIFVLRSRLLFRDVLPLLGRRGVGIYSNVSDTVLSETIQMWRKLYIVEKDKKYAGGCHAQKIT